MNFPGQPSTLINLLEIMIRYIIIKPVDIFAQAILFSVSTFSCAVRIFSSVSMSQSSETGSTNSGTDSDMPELITAAPITRSRSDIFLPKSKEAVEMWYEQKKLDRRRSKSHWQHLARHPYPMTNGILFRTSSCRNRMWAFPLRSALKKIKV